MDDALQGGLEILVGIRFTSGTFAILSPLPEKLDQKGLAGLSRKGFGFLQVGGLLGLNSGNKECAQQICQDCYSRSAHDLLKGWSLVVNVIAGASSCGFQLHSIK
jgi:hypothetical protein